MKGWGGTLMMLLALSLSAPTSTALGGKLTEHLRSALRYSGAEDQVGIWVQFADKGAAELRKAAIPRDVVTERALLRRLTVLPADRVVDYADLPVDESYIRTVAEHVAAIRQRSRWFNAVSAIATPAQIEQLATIPFVSEIDLIVRYRRDRTVEQPREAAPGEIRSPLLKTDSPNALDYGNSLAQVSLLNIPAVHNTGNAAEGIIIGVFDNGFRLPNHQAFDSLKIIGTRDFVDHKTSVVPNNPNPAFGSHGINTLSTIGGFKPGSLIGPAYKATYVLARTENDSSETPIEEDNWAAAIEWAESLGVQVTTTSLGYLDYDRPYTSWTWQDMNGRTTKITRAAAEAVRKGVIVVNAAGNNAIKNDGTVADPSHNCLDAPADADSVIAVGAVTPSGLRANFSSFGPTTSIPPHIKPDVMATGTSIWTASGEDPAGYTLWQGTSFSCPLAAGVAALVLKAHPAATPMKIIEALKMTASRASTPDNLYGWGIIDAAKAIYYLTPFEPGSSQVRIEQNFPNPFNLRTTIVYNLLEASTVTLRIYDILGREVKTLVNTTQAQGLYFPTWDGSNNEGGSTSSGVYFYRLEAQGISGTRATFTKKMMLLK